MTYPELLKHIMTTGHTAKPHGREIREVLKTQLEVTPACNLYAWPGIRPYDKIMAYLWNELAWYLSGDRMAKHIGKYAGLWEKIKNPDGTLNSNYGFLVFYNKTWHPSLGKIAMTPYQWALKVLRKDSDSRQAIMTYNTGGFNFDGNDDYICTQHQAFFIRDNVLRCFVALRSSDAIYGLTFNMPWWSLVHQQLWHDLKKYYPKLMLGNIEVDIYSAHVYAHHYELVDKMIALQPDRYWLNVDRVIPVSTFGTMGFEMSRELVKDYITVVNKEAAYVR